MEMEVVILPVCGDNYSYCVIYNNETVVIDACDARPILHLLEKRCLSLLAIFSTHHHGDHTGGNSLLKHKTGCGVFGGDSRIVDIDRIVQHHERIEAGPFIIECTATPGHTRGSFAYFFPAIASLFTGDTLFYAGCGRLFEGNAGELHNSLRTIGTFPATTRIYGGHEYTLDNLKFARAVEPDNPAIVERATTAGLQLHSTDVYGPALLSEELATNPFLRTGSPTIRRTLGLSNADEAMVFEELRRRKDCF
jgi:hydroxyacylglutathione hydrolase